VDHLHIESPFEISGLSRSELVVKDDQLRPHLTDEPFELLELARTQVACGVRPVARLCQATDHLGARALGEALKFVEALLEVPRALRQVEPDEDTALLGFSRLKLARHGLPPPIADF